MKKEEFIEKERRLTDQIKSATKELSDLRKDYTEAHREFPDGAKVKISNLKSGVFRYGYVVGMRINYKEDPIYVLKKAKKDGSISALTDYYNEFSEMLTPIS